MSSTVPTTDINAARPRTWATHCCGCCCDMRTAVIVVNLVSAGIAVVSMGLVLFAGHAMASHNFDNDALYNAIDDDVQLQEMKDVYATAQSGYSAIIPLLIAIMTLKVVASGLGVYGAMKFKSWPVVVSLVAFAIELIFSLLTLSLTGWIMPVFFAYPHYFFLKELKNSQENDYAANYSIHEDTKSSPEVIHASVV